MNEKRDIWISARAYALWEENGRINGDDHEHWLQAVREYELRMQTRASPDGSEILASRNTARRVSRGRNAPAQQWVDSTES